MEHVFDELAVAASRARGAEALALRARLENAASAAKLAALAGVYEAILAADGSAEREYWVVDNWAAACAQGSAALGVSRTRASHLLQTALTVRDRLPKVGAAAAQGLISGPVVALIAHRTAILTDPGALRAVDAELAARACRWGMVSRAKQQQAIDEAGGVRWFV